MSDLVVVVAVFVLVDLRKPGSNLGKPQCYPTTTWPHLPVVR